MKLIFSFGLSLDKFARRILSGKFSATEIASLSWLSFFCGAFITFLYRNTTFFTSLLSHKSLVNFCDVLVGGYITVVALLVPIGTNMLDRATDQLKSKNIREIYIRPITRDLYSELFFWGLVLVFSRIFSVYNNEIIYVFSSIFVLLRGLSLSISYSQKLVTIVEDVENAILKDFDNWAENECRDEFR